MSENIINNTGTGSKKDDGSVTDGNKDFFPSKKKKNKDMAKFFMAVIVFLIMTVITVYYFLNNYKIDHKIEDPQQILYSSIETMSKVKTYSFNGNMNFNFLTKEAGTLEEPVSFVLNVELAGKADETDANNIKTYYNEKINADIKIEGGSQELFVDLEAISFGQKTVYFKLNDYDLGLIGMTIGPIIKEYKGKWYLDDTEEENRKLKKFAGKDEIDSLENFSTKVYDANEIMGIYNKYDILKFKEDLGDTKINDTDVFHYKVEFDAIAYVDMYFEITREIFEESKEYEETFKRYKENVEKYDDAISDLLDNINIEIWIGKEDRLIYKMKINGRFDKESVEMFENKVIEKKDSAIKDTREEMENFEIIFDINFNMSGFNEPVEINKPENSENLTEVLEKISIDLNSFYQQIGEDELSISSKNLNIAKYYFGNKKYEEALEIAKEALSSAVSIEEEVEARYWIGLSNYKLGNITKAETEYQKTISLKPDHAPSHSSMASIFTYYNKYDLAVESAKKALEIDPDYSWAHSNLGIAYSNLEKLPEAIEEFKKAISIAPNVPDFHSNLAVTYYKIGKSSEAIDEYNKAIELDPQFEKAYNGLGVLYTDQKNTDKAVEVYKKGIENIPNSFTLRYELALIYCNHMNDYDECEKEILLSIESNKHYSKGYLTLFDMYAVFDRKEDLKILFSKYLENTGKSSEEIKKEINSSEWVANKEKIINVIDGSQ